MKMTYKKSTRKPRTKGSVNRSRTIKIIITLLIVVMLSALMLYMYKEKLVEIMSDTSLIEDDESLYSVGKDKNQKTGLETNQKRELIKHLEYKKNDRDYLNKIIEKYE